MIFLLLTLLLNYCSSLQPSSLIPSFQLLLSSLTNYSLLIPNLSIEYNSIKISGVKLRFRKINQGVVEFDENIIINERNTFRLIGEVEEGDGTVEINLFPDVDFNFKGFKFIISVTLTPNPNGSKVNFVVMSIKDISFDVPFLLQFILPHIDVNYVNQRLRSWQQSFTEEIEKLIKKEYDKFWWYFAHEKYRVEQIPQIIDAMGYPFSYNAGSKSIRIAGEWINQRMQTHQEL